jgi:large subunit ribosomal protein L21
MFAVIKTGGKQYIVSPGDKIKVEKLDAPEGGGVVFDALLIFGKETLLGTPYVVGYNIAAKVLRHGKGEKIIVYKYKPKKRYHKKQGHRQLYTEVEILSIKRAATAAKKKVPAKKTAKSKAPAKAN